MSATALAVDEVHLWRAQLDVDASVLAALQRSLSGAESERAARFFAPRDRTRYTAARGWLRVLLGAYLDMGPGEVRIAEDAGGKPRVHQPGARMLQFSLSHSVGVVVIAIALDREVGVDVEEIRRDIDVEAIARRLFSPREQQLLAALPDQHRDRAFFAFWTMKEAYVKATGIGLRGSLPSFDAPLVPGQAPIVLTAQGGAASGSRWSVRPFEAGAGYSAAVAVAGDGARIPQVAREIGLADPAPSSPRIDRP